MPGMHARLAPSAAERWIYCPGSIRLSEGLPPEEDSPYAHEGTVAHSLAELKASHAFGHITDAQFKKRRAAWRKENSDLLDEDEVEVEMERHTDGYVKLIQERAAGHSGSQLLFEQRVQTGIPECWGTADCIIVSPVHVEVIDFKYGAGVFVDSYENPQLKLYGVGALEKYGDILGAPKTVYLTVYQPRMDNVSTFEIKPKKLRKWRDSIIPIAEQALGPNAPVVPEAEVCRWCPAAGVCRARMEYNTRLDFAKPDLMDEEDIAGALKRIPEIRDWCNAVENYALDLAYSQETPIPGYKVVMSGGRRSIKDPDLAIKFLVEEKGFLYDEVAKQTIRTLGELEKLMGKQEFADTMGRYLKKSEGKPSLVPEDDNREAINPGGEAAKEFNKEDLL